MNPMLPDEAGTRAGDLESWPAFSLAYYEPILRALKILRVPQDDVDELAHSFLIKTAEKNFLDTFHQFQAKEEQEGRKARFRTYLYRSIQRHVFDHHRNTTTRAKEHALSPEAAVVVEADEEKTLAPDALYALDVLHQAMQALRRHCDRIGKPYIWTFFEELLLADEFRGRKAKTREELLKDFPGEGSQFIDNSLTTAKRAFRRFIQEVIPRGLRDGVPAAERFEEWMVILRESNASQFNLLHLAYRVTPLVTSEMSQAASLAMVVDQDRPAACYEEPSLVPDEDELALLLGFRLELPLVEMLEADELRPFIPASSGLLPSRRPGAGAKEPANRPARPFCLLTLIEPTEEESRALKRVDLVGLLGRLKSLAKQLRKRPDHGAPEVFAQLLYTTANVLALVHVGEELHSIGGDSLAGNVRWFLKRPWLDDRLRPLFHAGLEALGEPQTPAARRP
ncbi:MAG: hypothetical protein U0835_19160 [Isosphaeraceae bacterium]